MLRLLRSVARRVAGLPAAGDTGAFRPGHFHSPIPSRADIDRDAVRLFDRSTQTVPGVDLDVSGQLELLSRFAGYYAELPAWGSQGGDTRYHYDNDYFGHSDAIFLYCMLRHMQPCRVIEIGSGYSSLVMIDTIDRFLDAGRRLTCVDPDDGRLSSGLHVGDLDRVNIVKERVQDLPVAMFDALQANDFLFVDSSHVSKHGSDVNHIVFNVLPRLRKGVFIHFHDVFFPFEYPPSMLENGYFWNEAYTLRAFLQNNSAFRVVVWNEFLSCFYFEQLVDALPLCGKNAGGSLWLQRV